MLAMAPSVAKKAVAREDFVQAMGQKVRVCRRCRRLGMVHFESGILRLFGLVWFG